VSRVVLPLLFLAAITAYLDKSNVNFAAIKCACVWSGQLAVACVSQLVGVQAGTHTHTPHARPAADSTLSLVSARWSMVSVVGFITSVSELHACKESPPAVAPWPSPRRCWPTPLLVSPHPFLLRLWCCHAAQHFHDHALWRPQVDVQHGRLLGHHQHLPRAHQLKDRCVRDGGGGGLDEAPEDGELSTVQAGVSPAAVVFPDTTTRSHAPGTRHPDLGWQSFTS
jgi:hypothetical protein